MKLYFIVLSFHLICFNIHASFRLTPNEVYFDRPGTLYCVEDATVIGNELNGDK